ADDLVPGRAEEPGLLVLHRAQPRMGAQPHRCQAQAAHLCRPPRGGLARHRPRACAQGPAGRAGRRRAHSHPQEGSVSMAEIRVPPLGESITEATIATWFKKVGDTVAMDEMLCELETDKVTVEVPATAAGVLSEIVAKEGETVGVDALLATVDEKAAAKPAKDAAPEPGKEASENSESAPANEREVEINVPALGESVTEATVATWYKAVGDSVAQDEMLCEL